MKAALLIALAVLATTAFGVASAATFPAGSAATVKTAGSPFGRILVDSRGRTLYLFEKDTMAHSACSGVCAAYWPPLLTGGKPAAGAGAKKSLLGVTRRGDGTTQVTYAGHPLYRFAQDTKPGQTNGQNLRLNGAEWYVVSPAGLKIRKEAAR
jgi:predicted lipoprotein with Yx(FWY)xxD motif